MALSEIGAGAAGEKAMDKHNQRGGETVGRWCAGAPVPDAVEGAPPPEVGRPDNDPDQRLR